MADLLHRSSASFDPQIYRSKVLQSRPPRPQLYGWYSANYVYVGVLVNVAAIYINGLTVNFPSVHNAWCPHYTSIVDDLVFNNKGILWPLDCENDITHLLR